MVDHLEVAREAIELAVYDKESYSLETRQTFIHTSIAHSLIALVERLDNLSFVGQIYDPDAQLSTMAIWNEKLET